jgi:putative ABC transport system permease protein
MALRWLTDFRRDVLVALRLLPRRPGFAAVAFLTLSLGIGAPTAIFSVVHAVLLQPLPYPEADRLVRFRIETRTPRGDTRGFDAVPAAAALDWERRSDTLAALAVFNDRALTLTTPAGPFRLTGTTARPNLFAILGVAALAGRTFEPETTDPKQIVLSHATWLQHFGGDPAVVGSAITLDDEPYRLVGVMPPDFRFPSGETGFWVPLIIEPDQGRGMLLPAVARLKPGSSVAAVVEEGRRAVADTFGSREQATLLVRTVYDQLVGANRRVLWIVMTAVGLVSVIATTNIALLLLVRGATRERELSIRLAVGAGRGQLVRQLLASP